MKDKLINALSLEYEAVYLIDLENDSFDTIKILKKSPAMTSSTCWSKVGKAFVEECSEDSKGIIRLFADLNYLRTTLTKKDFDECAFRHVTSDSRWRRAAVQVIERNGEVPSKVLMTVSMIDKLTYQKERMFYELLSASNNKDDGDKSVYKMILNEDNNETENNLFDGIKILLVEDNEILRIVSKETLQKEGAIVEEAENGQIALDIIKKGGKFDFIIMDILMPVMDGIEATKQITKLQKSLEIKTPILGLTADATDERVNNIMNAGAYACLSKPLNPKEMSKVFISCMKEKSLFMEEKMAEINLLANTDMLTQSGNIVAYTHDIAELSKKMYQEKVNVGIVICDLDNLKGINDTYGHDVGDIYIKNCCNLIRDIFGKSKFYRVGGDEFALIVENDELSNIDKLISTINDKSRQFSSVKEVVNGRASVSAGYAIYDERIDQSLSDTMKRADVAMYENKQLHRKWSDTYSRIK